MYVSFDDGEHWQSLQLNLPVVPITDLIVHKRDNDLIAATQGRSFWILDDLNVVQQMRDAVTKADAFLFKPEDAYRTPGGGGAIPAGVPLGQNPPSGVVVYFNLKEKPKGEVTLEFLDAAGKSVKKFSSNPQKDAPPSPAVPIDDDEAGFGTTGATVVRADAGLNRFVWDTRWPDALRFPGLILWAGEMRGPRAVPGAYQVKLTANGQTYTQNFEIKKDPRIETTNEDFAKQFDLLMKIRNKLTETHQAILNIRDARRQIDDVSKRIASLENAKPVIEQGKALAAKLTAVEEALYQTKNQSNQDPLNFPIRLNNKLAALAGVVAASDNAPTAQSYVVYDDLVGRIDAELRRLAEVFKADVPAFNQAVRGLEIPAVVVKTPAAP
jgi:hypothetical protein